MSSLAEPDGSAGAAGHVDGGKSGGNEALAGAVLAVVELDVARA
jgi:hypothetical protein